MDPLFIWRDGGYFFPNSRVGLDNIVYLLRQDFSPQAIADSYPLITFHQVQRAIEFYRANQAHVDQWLEQCELDEKQSPYALSKTAPHLFRRLEHARRELLPKR
ncbi:MAG: DUF433 domain-containing protein [Bryobacteraceae bacterium]